MSSPQSKAEWLLWLRERRWCALAGCPARVTDIAYLSWLATSGTETPVIFPAARPCVVTVESDQGLQRYQVLQVFDDADALATNSWCDISDNPAGWARLAQACGIKAADVVWQPFRGEQSHSSAAGSGVMLKLLRGLSNASSVEIEMLGLLQSVRAVPGLRGALHEQGLDLALAVTLVPDATDGWASAIQQLAHSEPPISLTSLGTALADVHHALVRVGDTNSVPGAQLEHHLLARWRASSHQLPALHQFDDAVAGIYARLRGADVFRQQIHGDFHLGQCLHNDDGWHIIDFDGEPLASAQQRRALASPWRDLAGMARSLDYARSTSATPDSAEAHAWQAQAWESFYAGYLATSGLSDNHAEQALLTAFTVDKACYEVIYESRHRPEWLPIPFSAIARLTEQEK